MAELEARVETLEGTVSDHETRLANAELGINGKDFLTWVNALGEHIL